MASGLPGQDPAWQGPPPIRIEGEQTVLREKRLEDAEDDYAWRSDPELATFDAVPALRMNWPDFLRVYKDELRHPPPRQRNLSIEDRAGVHIGNCMYYNLDETAGHAELGIMVGRRDYWGQGYGSEAVAAMVQHIFQTTTIRRVYLHTLTWNVRAHKAFQKAGFTPIGERLRNGYNFTLMEVYRAETSAQDTVPDSSSSPTRPDEASTQG